MIDGEVVVDDVVELWVCFGDVEIFVGCDEIEEGFVCFDWF